MEKKELRTLMWPAGWSVQTFHTALLAVRQHRVPDLSADLRLSTKVIRRVVRQIEELSAAAGHYVFDNRTHPEAWQPDPHIPRVVMESIERVYVPEFNSPAKILEMAAAGQESALLLTRACRDCGDIVTVSVKMAANAIRRHNLEGDCYRPPTRCLSCRARQLRQARDAARHAARHAELRVSIGAQLEAKGG